MGFLIQAVLWTLSQLDLQKNNQSGTDQSVWLLLASFSVEILTVAAVQVVLTKMAQQFMAKARKKKKKKQKKQKKNDSMGVEMAVVNGGLAPTSSADSLPGQASNTSSFLAPPSQIPEHGPEA